MEGIRRNEFAILDRKRYFLTSAMSPLAKNVKKAIENFIEMWDESGALALGGSWSQQLVEAKAEFAKLINAKPEQIAYSFGVSVSSVSILSSFDLHSKNEFIFADTDFPAVPSNIMAMSDHGAKYKIARSSNGKVRVVDFEQQYSDKTALLTACEVEANSGHRIDINELTESAHKKEIPVFLDSYQSAGYLPIDVRKSNVDFLASGNQKYLLGGFGVSFVYFREDWIEKLKPSAVGWLGVEEPFDALYNGLPDKLNRPKDARKFQLGGPYFVGAATALAGMRMISEIGINHIYSHNMDITQEIIDSAVDAGYESQTPGEKNQRGSIVNIKIANAVKRVEQLRMNDFILDYRNGGIRLAPHFYNDSTDVDAFFEKLKELEGNYPI